MAEGRVKRGHRLAREGKVVSRLRIADGPFAEAKELIGGYWIVCARSLDEAATLMSHNPTMACGLAFEVRPIEHQRASAYVQSNETPAGQALSPTGSLSGRAPLRTPRAPPT